MSLEGDIDELLGPIENNKPEELSNLLSPPEGKEDSTEDNPYVTLLKNSPYLTEPLRAASLIPGRSQFIELLVNAGADVTSSTTAGYTALHLSAGWGVVPALRALLRLGADLDAKTIYGETAEDVAERYQQKESLKLFRCLAVQQEFKGEIAYARSTVLTPELFTGKLSKDEKTRITKVCDEKSSWLEANSLSATLLDVTEQREDFRSKLNTVLEKVQPVEQV